MQKSLLIPLSAALFATAGHAQWSDNFDSYAPGLVAGQGGWELWTTTAEGEVTTAQARSGPNSLRIGQNPGLLESDVVYQYSMGGLNPQYTSGKWVYRAWQYIPSAMTGTTYFILNSDYAFPSGPYAWSVQVAFTTSQVSADAGGTAGIATTITDQWVELRVHIDLDNDTTEFFYDGSQVGSTYSWTGGVFGGGAQPLQLSAVDLYANDASDCYYDDFEVYEMVQELHGPGCDSTVGPIGLSVLVPPSVSAGAYALDVTNMPESLGLQVWGASKEDFNGLPLPLDLAIVGAPGCQWHVSVDLADVLLSPTPAPGPYAVTSALTIPSAPILIGLRLYHQALAYDPTLNALGFAVSPASSIVIQP